MSAIEVKIVPSIPTAAQALSQGLTTKQALFIQYFIQSRNGTQAARLAGYSGNDNQLAGIAYDNLRKPHIKEAIDEHFKALHIGSEELLAEIASVVRVPLEKDALDASGVRVADKLKAAELAGKYLGLWDKADTFNPDPEAFVLAVCEAIERMRQQQAQPEAPQLEAVNPTDTTP